MKHPPIPEKLGCLANADEMSPTNWRPIWVALPSELDQLFRAAPKLVDAFRKILDLPPLPIPIGMRDPVYLNALRNRVGDIKKIARDALALLEPTKGDDDGEHG